jgi:hypothetical protein
MPSAVWVVLGYACVEGCKLKYSREINIQPPNDASNAVRAEKEKKELRFSNKSVASQHRFGLSCLDNKLQLSSL